MPVAPVFRQLYAIQYTGANSADCLAMVQFMSPSMSSWSVTSAGDPLVITWNNPSAFPARYCPPVPMGSWIILRADYGVVEVLSNMLYTRRYKTLSSLAQDIADMTQGAFGIASVPSLLATQSAVVAVTIKPTLTATPTNAVAILSGSVSLLAALSVTNISAVSGSLVNVTVQNTGLLTISGGSVFVHCG